MRILLAFASIVFTLAVCELLVRLLPATDGFGDRVRQFSQALVIEDAELSHRLRPGGEATVGGIHYCINAHGLRDADEPHSGDVPLVLVLGDSVTMGWGVSVEAAYPARLEEAIAQRGVPARVLNGGVLAYGVHQYGPWLTQLQETFEPDVVLVGYYPNDAEPLEATLREGLLGWSQLVRRLKPAVEHLFLRLGWRPTAEEYYRELHAAGSETWSGVERAIRALAEQCDASGTTCGLVLIPALIGDPYPLDDEHARLVALAGDCGLPVVDLAGVDLPGDDASHWVTPDDAHPDEAAHEAYAAALADWLIAMLREEPGRR